MAATLGLTPYDFAMMGTGTSTRAVTASTTKAGTIITAPKTGNISAIGFSHTANAGSINLDVRAETVSAQVPTGTLFGTNTNVTATPTVNNSFVWYTLTAAAAVTAGNLLGLVIGYISGTSATVNWRVTGMGDAIGTVLPYPVLMAAGTWAAQVGTPCICAKYDDGSIVRGCVPMSQVTNSDITSATNPNERASVWTAPVGATLIGIRHYTVMASTSTALTYNVYSGTGTTPMTGGTMTVAAGAYVAASQLGVVNQYFPAAITLTAGQQYRTSVLPTAAVAVRAYRYLFPSTAERDVVFGELSSDTRNGGAWVGEVTTTSEHIFPLFGSVTSGNRAAAA